MIIAILDHVRKWSVEPLLGTSDDVGIWWEGV